jgi:long-chain acyl-CoA synthetase
MTEATCTCTMNPVGFSRQLGSVGPALRGLEVTVQDSNGRVLPTGSTGEVFVRGSSVMQGFLNDPAGTAAVIRDGWLRTGDVGRLDDEGFLTLSGRAKDLIIRGGENISPQEVEEALLAHPEVAEVAVVGAPHAEWGEEVVAFIVPRGRDCLVTEEVLAFCRRRLAHFKVPRRIHVVPDLPISGPGKIDRTQLRSLASCD